MQLQNFKGTLRSPGCRFPVPPAAAIQIITFTHSVDAGIHRTNELVNICRATPAQQLQVQEIMAFGATPADVDQFIRTLNSCINAMCKHDDLYSGDQGDWKTTPGGPQRAL